MSIDWYSLSRTFATIQLVFLCFNVSQEYLNLKLGSVRLAIGNKPLHCNRLLPLNIERRTYDHHLITNLYILGMKPSMF